MAHWAVRRGRTRGVFPALKEALAAVRNLPHASHTPFDDEDDAWAFVLARHVHACCTTVYRAPPPSSVLLESDSSEEGRGGGGGWGYGVVWTERAFEGPRWEEAGFVDGDYAGGVEHAEFVAILRALELCPDKGAQVVISTSSKAAYDALQDKVGPTNPTIEPSQQGSSSSPPPKRVEEVLRRIQSACERMAHWPRFELCPLHEDNVSMRRASRMAWDAAYGSEPDTHCQQPASPATTSGSLSYRGSWAAGLQLGEDDDGLKTPKSNANSTFLFSPFSAALPPASTFSTTSSSKCEVIAVDPFSTTVAAFDLCASSLNTPTSDLDDDEPTSPRVEDYTRRDSMDFYASLMDHSCQELGASSEETTHDYNHRSSRTSYSPPSSDSDSDLDDGSSDDEKSCGGREQEDGAEPLPSEDEDEDDDEGEGGEVHQGTIQNRQPPSEHKHGELPDLPSVKDRSQHSPINFHPNGPILKLEDLIYFRGEDDDYDEEGAGGSSEDTATDRLGAVAGVAGVEEQVRRAMEEDVLFAASLSTS
ncbi:unnamed protein product [Tilletia controversa]|nr:hypothetical protein CF328_g4418 [Tilletia controversa]CAD6943060.1 unnamed protein product [Tilletia controversa]CAD6963408.1 unnamed protein product [Tilletia controversa]